MSEPSGKSLSRTAAKIIACISATNMKRPLSESTSSASSSVEENILRCDFKKSKLEDSTNTLEASINTLEASINTDTNLLKQQRALEFENDIEDFKQKTFSNSNSKTSSLSAESTRTKNSCTSSSTNTCNTLGYFHDCKSSSGKLHQSKNDKKIIDYFIKTHSVDTKPLDKSDSKEELKSRIYKPYSNKKKRKLYCGIPPSASIINWVRREQPVKLESPILPCTGKDRDSEKSSPLDTLTNIDGSNLHNNDKTSTGLFPYSHSTSTPPTTVNSSAVGLLSTTRLSSSSTCTASKPLPVPFLKPSSFSYPSMHKSDNTLDLVKLPGIHTFFYNSITESDYIPIMTSSTNYSRSPLDIVQTNITKSTPPTNISVCVEKSSSVNRDYDENTALSSTHVFSLSPPKTILSSTPPPLIFISNQHDLSTLDKRRGSTGEEQPPRPSVIVRTPR